MLALELLGCLWLCPWLCEHAVLPLLSSRFGRTCPKPAGSHASSGSLLVPPPPRPGSGRSAALRPTGRARGPSTTHGGEQTRVLLPDPASTPSGSLPRLSSSTDFAPRLTRVGQERRDSRTSPAPRLSPPLGRERPQRPWPAAPGSLRPPAARAGQGGLVRLILSAAGPSARPRGDLPAAERRRSPRSPSRTALAASGRGKGARLLVRCLSPRLLLRGGWRSWLLPTSFASLPLRVGARCVSHKPRLALFFPQAAVRAKLSVFPEGARAVALRRAWVCGCASVFYRGPFSPAGRWTLLCL